MLASCMQPNREALKKSYHRRISKGFIGMTKCRRAGGLSRSTSLVLTGMWMAESVQEPKVGINFGPVPLPFIFSARRA
jgi:hypothetical protein